MTERELLELVAAGAYHYMGGEAMNAKIRSNDPDTIDYIEFLDLLLPIARGDGARIVFIEKIQEQSWYKTWKETGKLPV